MWYVKLNDTIKTLDFLRSHSKSPIICLKLLFSKYQKSDWLKALVFITKKHLERCILTNGAASKNRTYDPTLTKGVLYH